MKHTIAEIKINYVPRKLKTRTKITHSEKAYEVLIEHWDKGTLEYQEEFKILLLKNKFWNFSCKGFVTDLLECCVLMECA